MPRGGKRHGAGAPKGNFNGLRTGRHSTRMLNVLKAVAKHPDLKQLAHELHHAGFFPAPNYQFNGDIRGFFAYLGKRGFDKPGETQSVPINCDQVHRRERPGPPPAADMKAREDMASQP